MTASVAHSGKSAESCDVWLSICTTSVICASRCRRRSGQTILQVRQVIANATEESIGNADARSRPVALTVPAWFFSLSLEFSASRLAKAPSGTLLRLRLPQHGHTSGRAVEQVASRERRKLISARESVLPGSYKWDPGIPNLTAEGRPPSHRYRRSGL